MALIMIGALTRAGKDTLAESLRTRFFPKAKIISLAKPLHRLIGEERMKDKTARLHSDWSGREIMNEVGKFMNERTQGQWFVRELLHEAQNSPLVICPDLRFCRELEFFRQHYSQSLFTIRIHNPQGYMGVSDMGTDWEADFVFDNSPETWGNQEDQYAALGERLRAFARPLGLFSTGWSESPCADDEACS